MRAPRRDALTAFSIPRRPGKPARHRRPPPDAGSRRRSGVEFPSREERGGRGGGGVGTGAAVRGLRAWPLAESGWRAGIHGEPGPVRALPIELSRKSVSSLYRVKYPVPCVVKMRLTVKPLLPFAISRRQWRTRHTESLFASPPKFEPTKTGFSLLSRVRDRRVVFNGTLFWSWSVGGTERFSMQSPES